LCLSIDTKIKRLKNNAFVVDITLEWNCMDEGGFIDRILGFWGIIIKKVIINGERVPISKGPIRIERRILPGEQHIITVEFEKPQQLKTTLVPKIVYRIGEDNMIAYLKLNV